MSRLNSLALISALFFTLGVIGCSSPAPLTGDGACEGIPNCTEDDANNTQDNVRNNVQDEEDNNDVAPNNTTEECAVGETECVNDTQQRRCYVQDDGTYWDTAQTCDSGSCKGNACCPDTCATGEKLCTQAGIQTCEVQPDGCLGLSAPAPCPEGQQCTAQGTCESSCTSDCTTEGESQCFNEAATRTCLAVEPGCNKWSPVNNCQSDYICEDGACIEECPNSCGFLDTLAPRCVAGRTERCLPNPFNEFCLQWIADTTSC